MSSYLFSVDKNKKIFLNVDGNIINPRFGEFKFNNISIINDADYLLIFDGIFELNKSILHNFVSNQIQLDSFFNMLIGDFTILVYNKLSRKIYFARDIMGHKGCYFSLNNNIQFFSNDGLLILDKIKSKKINSYYIYEYLNQMGPGHTECEYTPFENISKVMYGSYISYDTDLGYLCESNYYNPNNVCYQYNISKEEAVKLLNYSLEKSFKENVFSLNTKNIGVAVSGGFDSTLLCHYIEKNTKSNSNYLYYNFLPEQLTKGFSEKEYLDIVSEQFKIEIESISVPNATPTLFKNIISNIYKDTFEPGFLYSEDINRQIVDRLKQSACKYILFGHNETLFNPFCEQIVLQREFKEQNFVNKSKFLWNCVGVNFSKDLTDTNYMCGWNNYMGLHQNTDSYNSIFSQSLHEMYLLNYKNTFWAKVPDMNSKELKYHSIMRPGGDFLIGQAYEKLDITCIMPMHNKILLEYVLSIPSYLSKRQKKYLLKNLNFVPEGIRVRPKISSSPTDYFKFATKVASSLKDQDLLMAPFINEGYFRNLCKNIIEGRIEFKNDTRKFNVLIGLENFLRTYNPQINV